VMASTLSAGADTAAPAGPPRYPSIGLVRPRRNRPGCRIHACRPEVESSVSPNLQGARVEIRIGIINTGRELNFETATGADELRAQVASALEQNTAHVSFTEDRKSVV